MVRPTKETIDPLARLALAWETDAALAESLELRAHLLAVARQATGEVEGWGVLRRIAVVEVLMLYRTAIEKPIDALTLARVAAESLRSLRSLGLLRRAGPGPGGGGFLRPKMAPPVRRAPPTRPAGYGAPVDDDGAESPAVEES